MTNKPTNDDTIPELLDLKALKKFFGFSPATIKRERWEQKQVKTGKMSTNEVRNPDGIGYKLKPVVLYNKLMFERKDVEQYIADHKIPSAEENLMKATNEAVSN
jgi:hypothetical protein|tara:strand:+ start:643 stop:954 length:312 start_codon:yes stop_codon:yes gene_type:complete